MEERREGFFCSSSCTKGLELAEWWEDTAITNNRSEQWLKNNYQSEIVGCDSETRKRCGRRGGNTMTPTTTTMKQQSTSNYQAAEEEQQCGSAVEDDGGCQVRTVMEEQRLCGRKRA
jgi:hypothetical protein